MSRGPILATVLALCLLAAPVALAEQPPLPIVPADGPPPVEGDSGQAPGGSSLPAPVATMAAKRGKRPFWATVNICDTKKYDNALGVRASIPGNGDPERMYVRVRAQYFSGVKLDWLDVPGATSPWLYAGSARYVSRQSGWTFYFGPPPAGRGWIMRARVDYQWREAKRRKKAKRGRATRWVVAMRRNRLTEGKVRGVQGGDPKGYSQPVCGILPPPAP